MRFRAVALGVFVFGCGGIERAEGRDASFERAEDAAEDSVDVAISLTFYADCDLDGYAPLGAQEITAQVAPVGSPPCPSAGQWIERAPATAADCYDNDPRAYPGQLTYFASPVLGAGRFDFDCSGTEDLEPLTECVSECLETPEPLCVASPMTNCWLVPPTTCGSAAGTLQDRCTWMLNLAGGTCRAIASLVTPARGCR